MLTIYGDTCSFSTRKVYWFLDELGATYDRKHVDITKGEQKSESFLTLNPNGRVPVLKDGDFTLWEANAILRYLADLHESHTLVGQSPQERATIQQWMDWQNCDYGPALIKPWYQYYFKMIGQPFDEAVHAKAVLGTRGPLTMLNTHLSSQKYVVGERFTLADIVLAESTDLSGFGHTPLEEFPAVVRWFESISTREHFKNSRWTTA